MKKIEIGDRVVVRNGGSMNGKEGKIVEIGYGGTNPYRVEFDWGVNSCYRESEVFPIEEPADAPTAPDANAEAATGDVSDPLRDPNDELQDTTHVDRVMATGDNDYIRQMFLWSIDDLTQVGKRLGLQGQHTAQYGSYQVSTALDDALKEREILRDQLAAANAARELAERERDAYKRALEEIANLATYTVEHVTSPAVSDVDQLGSMAWRAITPESEDAS
jgi:hypothetical protein